MIDAHLPSRRPPRVLAVFSFRHDAHLVPALLRNIAPLVDGWISFDDRASEDLFSNETTRRLALLEAARDAGAEWALAVDPDERFDWLTRFSMRRLMDGPADAYWFRLREMYSPRHFRTDGVWGRKTQARLLRLTGGIVKPEGQLHVPWQACIGAQRIEPAGHDLYHLKMIAPLRRVARADLYERLDPERRMQPMGYRYLADDAGMALQRVPLWRSYWPRHVDDGGLWMPPPHPSP